MQEDIQNTHNINLQEHPMQTIHNIHNIKNIKNIKNIQAITPQKQNEKNLSTMKLFKKEFGYIFIGSIMFIASFMWRDLLKDLEDLIFPKNSLLNRFIYTLAITIILAFIIIYLKKIFELNYSTDLTPDITLDNTDEPPPPII